MLARPATLQSVLAEYGAAIVETQQVRGLRQTHADATLQKLWDRHGEAHVRDVLTCLLQTDNNANALVKPVISATSALLLAHGEWWQRDASAWLEVFDGTNLAALADFVRANKGAAAPKDAIAHELFSRLQARFEPSAPTLWPRADY